MENPKENTSDIIELLDTLSGMVSDAWGVPIGNDKCIIEREKAMDIINKIKNSLPASISEAKRLVDARDQFIGNAKREAEAMRKTAEEKARIMVEQQEVVRTARQQAAEMISSAEAKSNELRRVASDYADGVIQQAEDALNSALAEVNKVHGAFRASTGASPEKPSKTKAKKNPEPEEEEMPEEEEANFREFKDF